MMLEEVMVKKVITLHPKATIAAAIKILETHRIRHIPIVDEQQHLLGIISDRDVRDASPSIFRKTELYGGLKDDSDLQDLNQPVERIMTTNVITGDPHDFVEEIAAVLFERRISCVPITKSGKLVGIVTDTDVLHSLVQLTGAHQPGSRIEIKVENKAGMLSEAASVFKKKNMNILSVLVNTDRNERYKVLVFRVQTINTTGIVDDLRKEGFDVLWPDLPGGMS